MPKLHNRRKLGKSAREEIVDAEWRCAHVEYQPLARHAQVCAFIREDASFRELHARDFQARNLLFLQFLLHGDVKVLRGRVEVGDGYVPVTENVNLFRFEEVKHLGPFKMWFKSEDAPGQS